MESIVTQILEGRAELYRELISSYSDTVRVVGRSFKYNSAEIEDLIQETFIKVYQNLATYRAECSLKNWIRCIARNLCINTYRKRSEYLVPDYDQLVKSRLINWDDPEQILLDREIDELKYQQINCGVAQLNPGYRKVIELRYANSLSIEDTAIQLGITSIQVKQKCGHAMMKLKSVMCVDT